MSVLTKTPKTVIHNFTTKYFPAFSLSLLQRETSIIDNLICLVVAVVDDKFLESARLVSDKYMG